jgi:hypothetical protein
MRIPTLQMPIVFGFLLKFPIDSGAGLDARRGNSVVHLTDDFS